MVILLELRQIEPTTFIFFIPQNNAIISPGEVALVIIYVKVGGRT